MILLVQRDLPYLPLPNLIEITASNQLCPSELTATSFVLPFTLDGGVIMANNCRRGLEIPGGHREPGESVEDAAVRECMEETACHVSKIMPIGYHKMVSQGTVPDDWSYPHPISYQQFFTGFVDWQLEYIPNDECTHPVKLMPDEVEAVLSPERMALYMEAFNLLFRKTG